MKFLIESADIAISIETSSKNSIRYHILYKNINTFIDILDRKKTRYLL